MKLLDLPLEIFRAVLKETVLLLDLKESVKLRLVQSNTTTRLAEHRIQTLLTAVSRILRKRDRGSHYFHAIDRSIQIQILR